MPLECPVCRHPFSRLRSLARGAWSRWRCPSCDSLLGISIARRLIASIPWIAILVVLLLVLKIMSWGLWFALPILVAFGTFNYMLFERIVVHERVGFRCKSCGYDLQGQRDPHCPECGDEFDEDEVRRMSLTDPGRLRHATGASRAGRWVAIVMVALLSLLVAGQIVHLYFLRASALNPSQETKRVLDSVLGYATDHGGKMPAHALQHVSDDCLIVLTFESRTNGNSVPVPGAGNLNTLLDLPAEQKGEVAAQAAAALPRRVIAHRFGDFVFSYHGVNPNSADPQLWLVILWPDPDCNPPPQPDDAFYAGRCDGSVESLRVEEVTAALMKQNALRQTSGLPPLPHPATITHGSPAAD